LLQDEIWLLFSWSSFRQAVSRNPGFLTGLTGFTGHRKKVRKIVEAEGYGCPEICSPEELLEVEK